MRPGTVSFMNFMISLVVVIALAIVLLGGVMKTGPDFLIWFFGALVFLAALVFVLGRYNMYFTFVQEGTAKIVTVGDAFSRALIQWKGRTFAYRLSGVDRWTVIEEGRYVERIHVGEDEEGKPVYEEEFRWESEPWHPFGGLRWVGLWPLCRVHTYPFRWTGVHEDGTPKSHEEVLDKVMLKDFVYFAELADAEDTDMVPLTVKLLITIRVVNPYKALFEVADWLESVLNRIKPLFREFIAHHPYATLISEKQAVGGDVWRELALAGVIEEFERDYGVHIKEGGIEMKDITPQPEYQKLAALKYTAQRRREQAVIETAGAVLGMMAEGLGKSVAEVQEMVATDPEQQRAFMERAQDLITRRMSGEYRSLVDIRTDGAGGIEQTLLDLVAAWQRMPIGRGPEPEQAAEQAAEKTEKAQETETEEQKPGEAERKKEKLPPIRENPEEDVRLGGIILAALAAVLTGGGYLLIRFFLR